MMVLTKYNFYEIVKDGMASDEVREILQRLGAKRVAVWDNLYGFRGSEEEEAEFYEFAESAQVGEGVHLAGDEIGHFVVTPFFDQSGRLRYLRFEWIPGFGYSYEEYRIYRLPSAEPEFLLRKNDVFYYLTIWHPNGPVIRLIEDYDTKIMDYIVQVFIDDELRLIYTEGAGKPWFFDKEKLDSAIRERGTWQTLKEILEYLVRPVVSLLGDGR